MHFDNGFFQRRGTGVFKEDINPKELSRFMVSRFEGAILLAKAKKFLSPMEDIICQGKNLLTERQADAFSKRLDASNQ